VKDGKKMLTVQSASEIELSVQWLHGHVLGASTLMNSENGSGPGRTLS
jgi:hypothetical protein